MLLEVFERRRVVKFEISLLIVPANNFKRNIGLNHEKHNPENKEYLFYQDLQSRELVNFLFNVL